MEAAHTVISQIPEKASLSVPTISIFSLHVKYGEPAKISSLPVVSIIHPALARHHPDADVSSCSPLVLYVFAHQPAEPSANLPAVSNTVEATFFGV